MIHQQSLYDYGHNLLPFIFNKIPNYLLVGYIIYFILRFFKIDDMFKILWSITILFTIRLFTFSLTIDPPLLEKCDYRHIGEPIRWNVLENLFKENDNTCLDYMFSGHALYFTIALIYILNNPSRSYKWERIIASRIHCTSDVSP